MTLNFKIQRPVLIILAFFCSIFCNAGDVDLLKDAQKALKKKDLKEANAYILSAEKETEYTSNPEFWYIKGVLAIQVAQSTVYAYEQLFENPLIVAYLSIKKALELTNAESGLLEDYKPQIELLKKLLFNEAGKNYNKQHFSEAIRYFTPLIDLNPRSEYYVNRGVCYLRNEFYIAAQKDFKEAIDLEDNSKLINQYYLEALIRDTISDFSLVNNQVTLILERFPDEVTFKKKKILFYEQQESSLNAEQKQELNKLYKEVLKEEPTNTNVAYNYSVNLFNKAVELQKKGNKTESKTYAEETIKVIDTYLNYSEANKDMFESIKRKSKLILLN